MSVKYYIDETILNLLLSLSVPVSVDYYIVNLLVFLF